MDLSKALGSKLNTAEGVCMTMRALFYILKALNYDLTDMRFGSCHLADSAGYGWHNVSWRSDGRAARVYGGHIYAVGVRQLCLLNTSVVARWFYYSILQTLHSTTGLVCWQSTILFEQ